MSTNPGSVTRFVAPGSVTGAEFGLFETRIPAGGPGAVPHYHGGFSEAFYVLSGRLAVLTDRQWRTAGAGDFVYVPARVVHAFHAEDDEEAGSSSCSCPARPASAIFEASPSSPRAPSRRRARRSTRSPASVIR